MSSMTLASIVGWLTVVTLAGLFRGRAYATFRGVLLAVHGLIVVAVSDRLVALSGGLLPDDAARITIAFLHATVYGSAIGLVWPRMRPLAYRLLVSWPAAVFQAGTMLAFPWAVAEAIGVSLPAFGVTYAMAAVGLAQGFLPRREHVDLDVRRADRGALATCPTGVARADRRPLRIAQITDPHLGPFMSVGRLRRISQGIVRDDPDLVFLTGDFLTMESQRDSRLLREALAPLAAMKGRVFACFGNHDHEAPETVTRALRANGIRLLVDDAATVQTAAGMVQIVGADFRWRRRDEHLRTLCAAHPRRPDHLRLLLLHDPGALRDVPEGEADLVLSGHTHGGQVGLVSLGLDWTMMRPFTKTPDHGFWSRGRDRLYVHRGTGHYGFPVRIGVPPEIGILSLHHRSTSA